MLVLSGELSADTCTSRVGCTTSTTSSRGGTIGTSSYTYSDVTGYSVVVSFSGSVAELDSFGLLIDEGRTSTWIDGALTGETQAVFALESLDIAGTADITIEGQSDTGKKLLKEKVTLAAAYDDGGTGVSAVPLDKDALTLVSVSGWSDDWGQEPWEWTGTGAIFSIVSGGWSAESALPEVAEVAFDAGDTLTLTPNSIQRTGEGVLEYMGNPSRTTVDIRGSIWVSNRQACGGGTCVEVDIPAGRVRVVTVQGYDAAENPLPATVRISFEEDDGTTTTEEVAITDADNLAVVFAAALDLDGDPAGMDLSADVTLEGAEGRSGKRDTLSKGSYEASLGLPGEVVLLGGTGDVEARYIGGRCTCPNGFRLLGGLSARTLQLNGGSGFDSTTAVPALYFTTLGVPDVSMPITQSSWGLVLD